MKNRILIMLLLCLLAHAGWAQEKKGSFTIQPKVGVAFTTLSGDTDGSGVGWHVGLAAGAEAEWYFADKFSLISGLSYRRQGSSVNEKAILNGGGMQLTADFKSLTLDYFCVPVMASFHVSKLFSVRLGLEGCFLLSAKARGRMYGRIGQVKEYGVLIDPDDESQYNWIDYDKKLAENVKPAFHDFTLNVPIGVSFEYRHVALNLTYHLELLRAFDYDGKGTGSFPQSAKLTNQCIELTAGYKFKL